MMASPARPRKATIKLSQITKESIGVVGSEFYTQKSITLLCRKSNQLQNNEGENPIITGTKQVMYLEINSII